jgi:hypothetical protein
MAKVGRFITDPKEGAYCQLDLDDGKILVSHDKGGFKGGTVSVVEKKFWGGQTFLTCRLDSPQGQAALRRLTAGAAADSALATPLGAFVEYLKDCGSLADVKARCTALGAPE